MSKYLIIIVVLSFVGVFIGIYNKKEIKNNTFTHKIKEINLKGDNFILDIADNVELRTKGLSGRKYLAENTGMLFVFDIEKELTFWMKDMYFPVDIVWMISVVGENGLDKKIVHIEHSVKPETYPKIFGKDFSAQYVIEFNSGIAKKYNLNVGDIIYF